MSTPDWADFRRRHWERQPVCLDAEPPASLGELYELAVAACAPFRAGTRFRALPDVRFRTDQGVLRAPGDLLPGESDATVAEYQERLAAALDGGWLLTVTQPFHLDHHVWTRVLRVVEGLWRETGRPLLPLTAQLTLGERHDVREELDEPALHANLVWVLHGTLHVRLWPEAAGTPPHELADPGSEVAGARKLTATDGGLMYWPAGHRAAVHHGGRCVTLRLRIPTDRRLPTAEAKNLLTDAVQAGPDYDGTVPFLPFPAPASEDGSVPQITELISVMAAARKAADDPRFLRGVRVRHAARASSAGLEPPPAPRAGKAEAVARGCHLRVSARILRMPDGPRRAVWACNGHAFSLSGEAADRVLARLRPGAEICVGSLCREVAAEGDDAGVLALLGKLHALRAVEVLDGDEREGATACRH